MTGSTTQLADNPAANTTTAQISPDTNEVTDDTDQEARRAAQAATADVRALTEARTPDDIWAAAKRLGQLITDRADAVRQERCDARNARRRARYRANPPKRKPKATVIVDDDLDVEPGCRCHVVQRPPCAWCEDGGDVETEGQR
ncbi:hypothetical protein ABZ671_01335 [Micromonospora sp. NPDC006766]|uniref:hypothetical protein n=1 Tax=Micromonospora sp. NPDC006766 TaxID=3154778 RepID=UPI0033D8D85E